jgi:hypothetical protein
MSASGVDSVEKVFGGDDRILRGPLMRFARGDVSDHTFLRKRTIEVRIDATEYCRGGVGQKSTFAEFSEWFDFHLLQHYRGEKQTSVTSDCDWPLLARSGRSPICRCRLSAASSLNLFGMEAELWHDALHHRSADQLLFTTFAWERSSPKLGLQRARQVGRRTQRNRRQKVWALAGRSANVCSRRDKRCADDPKVERLRYGSSHQGVSSVSALSSLPAHCTSAPALPRRWGRFFLALDRELGRAQRENRRGIPAMRYAIYGCHREWGLLGEKENGPAQPQLAPETGPFLCPLWLSSKFHRGLPLRQTTPKVVVRGAQ